MNVIAACYSALTLSAIAAGVAHADAPAPATYALVVGSNPGGPGQQTLRYAEEDARRMGQILAELGGYPRGDIDIVVRPTPDQLRDRLGKLALKVAQARALGRETRVFFYYSGHARAAALDLGPSTMPLAELRQRLFAASAALTVVVLDACQSGAFSRVKGATPAADFSFNSRSQLDAKGIAVLASSSDSELSQESEHLRGSYFTHHLMVGMRGAGDANRDGAVSVDEAYRYAYHQTLIATSATAVGGQHVSLEVDLKGHGEVPLAFPRAATATIELPAGLEGHALVSDRRARAVVAETHKVIGAAVRIAVAPGDYDVIVRQGDRVQRCPISVASATGIVDLARCSTERVAIASTKGEGGSLPRLPPARPTRIGIGLAIGPEYADDFTQTLENFGYTEQLGATTVLSIGAARELAFRLGRFWVGGRVDHAQSTSWRRPTELEPLAFDWTTTSALATARVFHAFGNSSLGTFSEVSLGLAMARTRFSDAMGTTTRETYFGPALGGTIGLALEDAIVDGLGLSVGYEGMFAWAIENNLGQTHAGGGSRVSLGITYSY